MHTFWVARNDNEPEPEDNEYLVSRREPYGCSDGSWRSPLLQAEVCVDFFEQLTGVSLQPGEVVEVRLIKVKGG